MKRARPVVALDWGILACWLFAAMLLLWSTFVVDWWSTALVLDSPFREAAAYAALGAEARTLLEGDPWMPITLIVLMVVGASLTSLVLGPYAVTADRRYLLGSVAIGLVGLALTMAAAQFDSPVKGLVSTNAWIPAVLAWLVYFGAIVVAVVGRDTQLEFEPRPDSSDG